MSNDPIEEPQEDLTAEQVEEISINVAKEKEVLWETAKETGVLYLAPTSEKILAEQEKYRERLLAARNLEKTPEWVQAGPRPSDEALALGPPDDPLDKTTYEGILTRFKGQYPKIILEGRLPSPYTLPFPPGFKVEPVDADGVRCAWCNWPGTTESTSEAKDGVMLFLHGGGGFMGDIEANLCARLSHMSGLRVLSVDYRLAPEHSIKTGIEDCVTAYLWLTKTVVSPDQVVIYGPSYGGFAVMATLQALLQRTPASLPACAVSESPIFPGIGHYGKLWEILDGIRIWDAFGIRVPKSWNTEIPSAKSSFEEILKDPFYDVMGDNGARLKGLPPLFVAVGGLEHVENQINAAKALAKTCKEVGGEVELEIVRNLRHCPVGEVMEAPEATAYVARMCVFIHKHLVSRGN